MTANALFLVATQQGGQLAINGVLAALYPVSTVVLAQVVLRERLVGAQLAGLGAAVAAVVLITLPVWTPAPRTAHTPTPRWQPVPVRCPSTGPVVPGREVVGPPSPGRRG